MFGSRRRKKRDEPFEDVPVEVEFQNGGYAVDLVLCIDVTASMTSIIERVFAPDRDPWTGIAGSWNNTLHSPSKAGTGLDKVALDDVIGVIAGSV
ncbi:hypothetical protein [Phytohabitans houttuyneae]|uniref:VWA domain-containing protein n=1 Tax=Phytohabitans houttuyneae TaxID=1076126 RepID=A0A6V8K345_9ACTN|nr:hypothetical protein [Phytohabitans houttuyneae]GFJ79572.1 hypothetical protein Phou_037520 [Phytohabitans houttuyneae]